MFENRDQALWYLAGIIDGEGHISMPSKDIQITSVTPEIIEAVVQACEYLGYNCGTYVGHTKKGRLCYDVRISRRKTICKAASELPLQCPAKKALLLTIPDSYVFPEKVA